MLYRPEAFEPLTDEPWDEARVRAGIQSIVDETDSAYDPETLWPAHEADAGNAALPRKTLYAGAAGIVLALETLRRRGHAEVRTDLRQAIERALELEIAEPEMGPIENLPEPRRSSLVSGETGVLLVAWALAPTHEIADRLLARVRENMTNNLDELMWGIPGTMLAAHAMHRWTRDARWLDAWNDGAREVRARRDADGLWTQHFGRHDVRYLGPIHGAVGNTCVLLQGERDENVEPLVTTLAATAVVEDGLTNWPPDPDGPLVAPRDGAIRVQWCHGAPGIVTSTASFLPLELLLAGAELTWRAGAHGADKGAGLCHGTAGNGYALLATFERTGDEQWLDRARRFAVHALAQIERATPRHSLFGGDIGVALFASDCIDATPRFPVMDGFRALE